MLVFGAGTNYALLLISRYREELQSTADHRRALSAAWRHTAPAILASNVTVVLALLTLVLAVIPGTHGLGVSSAIGLLIALAAVLFLLPPLLAVCGRNVFWPFIPRPGELGLIVGVGVIVDTLVVRTVIVPAIFALVGDRISWPRRPGAAARRNTPGREESTHEPRDLAADAR